MKTAYQIAFEEMKESGEDALLVPCALISSPTYRALNTNEYRALACINLALGPDHINEGLSVTHTDFEQGGVNHKRVASTLRVLEALRIIDIIRSPGMPNLYRLAFLPRSPTADDASDEYLKFTLAEAKAIAKAHRLRGNGFPAQ